MRQDSILYSRSIELPGEGLDMGKRVPHAAGVLIMVTLACNLPGSLTPLATVDAVATELTSGVSGVPTPRPQSLPPCPNTASVCARPTVNRSSSIGRKRRQVRRRRGQPVALEDVAPGQ